MSVRMIDWTPSSFAVQTDRILQEIPLVNVESTSERHGVLCAPGLDVFLHRAPLRGESFGLMDGKVFARGAERALPLSLAVDTVCRVCIICHSGPFLSKTP
jgi:hypothetical protein